MKILELDGLKYSRNEFDGYTNRAKVVIKTTTDEHNLDIYTTDTSKKSVENVLLDRKSDDVFSLRIIHWTTKEQDDLDAKFIDEFFKKDETTTSETPMDKTLKYYTERLSTLKRNRDFEFNALTDVDMNDYDTQIKLTAEFVQALKTLK